MNRRSFLKAAAATFIVPEIIVPERKIWALDSTMLNLPPSRREAKGDDAPYIQWHIDNGITIPSGNYCIATDVFMAIDSRTGEVPIGKHTIITSFWPLDGTIPKIYFSDKSLPGNERIMGSIFTT